MTTLSVFSHLFFLLIGGAAGGYVGYRWGGTAANVVQAVEGQGNASPPKTP